MTLVDEVQDTVPPLSPEKREELFYRLVRGKDATEKIRTSRGDFTVKYPKHKDLVKIGKLCAFRRSGIPAASFDPAAENILFSCAYLDVCVTDTPAWFKTAKKENPGFGWEDMPDEDFVAEVFAKAYEFRRKVQKELAGSEEAGDKPGDEPEGDHQSVGGGVFEGISGESG